MLHDVYVIDNEKGELLPAMEAIHEFHKTHDFPENWLDYYTVTDYEVPDRYIAPPDFTKAINI